MHALIEHPDGSRTAYFGLSDLQRHDDTQLTLWFHTEVNVDERQREVEGTVMSAVSETCYNEEGAFETIGDTAAGSETKVIVGISGRHPAVETAARELRDNADLGDDLTVHDLGDD
jgi:hypothetical protein